MKKILLFLLFIIPIHFFVIEKTQWHLPLNWIQQPLMIDGVIDSIPQNKFHGTQFQFQTQHIQNKKITTKIVLSWYQQSPSLHVGQHWHLSVKLKPPIGSHNPGGFDYAAFLLSHDVNATGYVISQNSNQWIDDDHAYFLDIFREKVVMHIRRLIHDTTIAAFISALSVGCRDGLSESDWQVFQKTGTNHLIAIAGLHIGFIASIFYFLVNRCSRYFPRLLLRVPAQRIALMTSFVAASGYAILSGLAIPAERACLMLCFFVIADYFYYRIAMWQRCLLAGLLILFINPMDFFDASFWLSFTSIAALIWVMSGRLQSFTPVMSWVRMQSAILIGLLSLMFFFFQQISLIAFFTNAIAIPWIGFLILPLSVLATMFFALHFSWLSDHLFLWAGKCLWPLWQLLTVSAHLPFASFSHAVSHPWVMLMGIIASFALLAPRGIPARGLCCLGFLPLFFYHPALPKTGDFRATVIDVGQGLSVLIQTTHHVMLYDTGAHYPGGFDFGESVVSPYLRYWGISHIDRLEISHGDNDHSGGVSAVMKNFVVNTMVTSAPALITQWRATPCFTGQSWQWDGVQFDTLNPVQNTPYEDNNSSCVVRITGAGGQLLLTGDIEAKTEAQLIQHKGEMLQSTVLIVPHHGSRTSSSEAFIHAVSPKIAVISAGKYNHYHLPAPSVISRYFNEHIKLYNTADTGAIIIRFHHAGAVVSSGL